MESQGREDRKDNDSFFTSSLIDYIARKTKNKRTTVVRMLGEKEEAQIPTGNFDNQRGVSEAGRGVCGAGIGVEAMSTVE